MNDLPRRVFDAMKIAETTGQRFKRHTDDWTPIVYFDNRPVSIMNLGLSRSKILTEITRIVAKRNPNNVIVLTTGYVSSFTPNADGSPVDPLDRPLPHEDPNATEHLWVRGLQRGDACMIEATARIVRLVDEPPTLSEWSVGVRDIAGIYSPAIINGWKMV